jgi:outer membrane protein OmpA-like peptidoglycan-associated protein
LRLRAVADYAREPLVLLNDEQEYDRVVTEQLWLHALASYSLAHRFLLSIDVPALLLSSGEAAPAGGATAPRPEDAPLLGDLRLGARAKLLGPAGDGIHFAVGAGVALPTASDGGYAGDDGFGVRGALLLDGLQGRFFWAIDAGVRTRPGERLPGVLPTRVGSALTGSLAARYQFDAQRHADFGAELSTALTFGESARLLDERGTVAYLLLGARWRVVGGPIELGGGMGPGIGAGPGAADYRVLAFVGWSPEQPPPPPDADDDGVPDRTDACIDLPGQPSREPLLNGCPEPPRDFDGDEIPDEFDACPKEPGEPTGRRGTHGCPKPVDSDGDGIADREDACPKERGVAQADRARNGCPAPPPPPPPAARLEAEQIVISQQVQFEHGTAVLRPESDAILNEVLRVLREHSEVERVEVQGHTDNTGPADVNRTLSQARAESVVRWLVQRGIAPARLQPRGYGPDRPIADNASDEGRAKNRRVEFRVQPAKAGAP